jgi:glycogen debranching enzyme
LSIDAQATEVIKECRTSRGFFASTHLYPELWVRDLVYSEEVLVRLGYVSEVKAHFEEFLKRQKPNGQIPNVITSRQRGLFNQAFHSWTADNEILFLIGLQNFSLLAKDSTFISIDKEKIERCLSFVRKRTNSLGLISGLDWRDAMPNYQDKLLLTNQLLLLHLYRIMGFDKWAEDMQDRIVNVFYSDELGFFVDFVSSDGRPPAGTQRFDSLGNALAILLEVHPLATALAARIFDGVKSEYGYRNLSPPYKIPRISPALSARGANAFLRNGAIFRNRPHNYQNSAIWPFVEARIVRALAKAGEVDEASELAHRMASRSQFNEWYSPDDGTPRGSRGQLWTAAAVLQAHGYVSDYCGRRSVQKALTIP